MTETTPQTRTFEWTGRTDGPGPEHARWHSTVQTAPLEQLLDGAAPAAGQVPGRDANAQGTDASPAPAGGTAGSGAAAERPAVDLIGFSSDAGVARNKGRVGAAEGPDALRTGLASLAIREPRTLTDFGTIVVADDAGLEPGQDRLSDAVAGSVRRGAVPCVLGGGHETAWGTFRGLRAELAAKAEQAGTRTPRLGILNLDQHFDLREEDRPTSGTPFRQIAELLKAAGEDFVYGVVGLSEVNNTTAGFETAEALGVRVLLDVDCTVQAAVRFARELIDSVDALYMTLDLDVLPASVAPGVSAPAGYGVNLDIIRAVMLEAARSGKLAGFDVVELNPRFDTDSRTARTAARLIDDVVRALA
ncbi:formimidoylglutamase [Falsarthrobacter nasiphocae]|uniref:Formimidoylglutamase n=1 Tax=Falsarthrobacter nasiphocae TaxID=189863 RepID=A0AAE4C699_9MICC|nr:formimidoylglutamase [Falsarthrobacter nasiphocae]MDR6891922.1 formiminoglutamase [Falsarthrobacter nasiphocae]